MIDWNSKIEEFTREPTIRYVTYSYQEAFLSFLKVIAIVSIFAVINTFISVIIGVRKKDCITILVVNIMVKTIIAFLYKMLNYLFDLDLLLDIGIRPEFIESPIRSIIFLPFRVFNHVLDVDNSFVVLLFLIVAMIIEGCIYKKLIQNKKNTGMKLSVACNICTVVFVFAAAFGVIVYLDL